MQNTTETEIGIDEPKTEVTVVPEETESYTITVACTFQELFYAYAFNVSGMSDADRMRRALCYYDSMLFQKGPHFERILHAIPKDADPPSGVKVRRYDTERASGMLHKGMVDAYNAIRAHWKNDSSLKMHIASASIATPENILVKSRTLSLPSAFRQLDSLPEPIEYTDIISCLSCSRVLAKTGVCYDGLCPKCTIPSTIPSTKRSSKQ